MIMTTAYIIYGDGDEHGGADNKFYILKDVQEIPAGRVYASGSPWEWSVKLTITINF